MVAQNVVWFVSDAESLSPRSLDMASRIASDCGLGLVLSAVSGGGLEAPAERLSGGIHNAVARPVSSRGGAHNTDAVAVGLCDVLSACAAACVFALHNPVSSRVLSRAASLCAIPFVPSLVPDALPQLRRSVCAGDFFEVARPLAGPFAATLASGTICGCVHGMIPDSCGCISKKYDTRIPVLKSFEAFSTDTIPLAGASLVFAGGGGLGAAGFARLAECARLYGAALGGSRLAVDLGWCRSDMQVGLTGRSVAPAIYVAFGISGAVQHIAGIRNAARIYAVNTDRNAPIFQFADAGVVGDAPDIIERMIARRIAPPAR